MLRKIRLTFAMICFALITLLFLDFTGTLHGWFGWLAKIQFLPAVLALNVGVILFLVILTLVCGRIYCSVICPLGVFQDILAWLGRQPKKRRKLPYSYSPALSWLRYGVLGVFIIALIAGIGSLAALLYGAYNEAVFSMVGENGRKALRTKWFRHVRENGLNISKRFFSLHGLTSALRLRGFSADLRAIALHRACRWG